MKQIIVASLAILLLVRCEKEINKPQTTPTKSLTNLTRHIDSTAKSILNETIATQNNFLPCESYPPTDWRSCNYNGGVSDEPPITITTNASLYNGMLSFPTASDFLSTMEQLDEADENYAGYNSYMSLFSGNLDKIDSLLDVRGIDESSTFVNFETRFPGYISMRKDVEAGEITFLNNGGDPADRLNPENLNIYADDVFRTVLNKDGAVRIEGIILKYFENGVCYAIMNGNTTLLNKLNHPENYHTSGAYYPEFYGSHFFDEDTANVKLLTPYLLCSAPHEELAGDEPVYPCLGNYVGGRLMGTNCKLWYKKTVETKYDNNKRKYVSKIAVYNTFIYDVGLSKIRSYKLKTNGKWKPIRTQLSAYVKENNCSYYDKSKVTKFRKFRRAAKRDMATIIPGLGSLFQGIEWMFKNMLGNSNNFDNGYYRYFKTASNNGGFYGDNYCNGNRQLIQSQW